MSRLRALFKMHGGKYYLAPFILKFFPENYQELTYLEPYAGAAAVYFYKNPSKEEILNDIHPGIYSIFESVRDHGKRFLTTITKLPYHQDTFQESLQKTDFKSLYEHAINEYVLRRMSRGGLKTNFAYSTRLRGGKPGDVNAWEIMFEAILPLSERLKATYLFNTSALDVIKAWDFENTFIYADPPYVPDTRVSQDAYEYEMTADDHVEMAEALRKFKGKVILSGYPSNLYKRLFRDWHYEEKKMPNHASQKKTKDVKTEGIWLNY